MSEFIIASISDADKFIQYDKLGKMCITNRREKAARFSDSGKAWRILTTQMSKKKRDGWKVIAYESETSKNKEAVSNSAPRFKASPMWKCCYTTCGCGSCKGKLARILQLRRQMKC